MGSSVLFFGRGSGASGGMRRKIGEREVVPTTQTKRSRESMTNILVVGGAGYIGSHTCLYLANKGFTPVVYNNVSNGHPEFVKWGVLEEGDIRDGARLDAVLAKYRPAAVVHFA